MIVTTRSEIRRLVVSEAARLRRGRRLNEASELPDDAIERIADMIGDLASKHKTSPSKVIAALRAKFHQ